MYCKHCGREIDNDSRFCKYCGTSLRFGIDSEMRSRFESFVQEIQDKRNLSVRDIRYIAIMNGMTEVRSYRNTLADCNLSEIDYVIAVSAIPYITVGGNPGTGYELLGMFDSDFSQVNSIPISRDAEIYGISEGEWNSLWLSIRRADDLSHICKCQCDYERGGGIFRMSDYMKKVKEELDRR